MPIPPLYYFLSADTVRKTPGWKKDLRAFFEVGKESRNLPIDSFFFLFFFAADIDKKKENERFITIDFGIFYFMQYEC